ncbi:MAG: Na+/H+ antiporter [Actinomycetota bacterium]|jgi:monovalent cation/hydrogen antiporter
MEGFEIVLATLLISVAGLNAVASRLGIPYPIVLVLGGLVIGAIPGSPRVELDPELVLLVFLPPLLYVAAFFSDLRALRADARALSLTSIGLVLATMAAVAALSHAVLDLSWAMAFVLGAIVSPTDPVAATAIMRRLGVPRRVVNLVEGESLVNDAAALVGYRVALGAATAGGFSLAGAALEFIVAATGGVAIGLAVGWLIGEIRRRLDDPPTEITITLATGYAAFLPAEELHLSGVLAVVAAGLYLGWRAPQVTSPSTRLQGFAVWEILTFLLNATLFILIGLQLPVILDDLTVRSPAQLMGSAALVAVAVITVRFVWLFTTPYVLRAVDRRPQQRARRMGAAPRVVIAWSGLRGAVSLAAALAIPLETDAGAALPGRDLIVFVTFAVVLVTVVFQGLTLPALARRLGVTGDGHDEEHEELTARLAASKAALVELVALAAEGWASEDTIEKVRLQYEQRKRRFAARAGKIDDDGYEDRSRAHQRVLRRLYAAERQTVLALRNSGDISNDVMHRLERELDLEESHLEC